MLIYSGTGVTTTGKLVVNKGFSALIVSSSLTLDALSAEQIEVLVERKNGKAFEVTQGAVSVKDFILSTTESEDAMTYDDVTGLYTAVCELTGEDGGAIDLAEGENIVVSMTLLTSGATYRLNGTEEPFTTNDVRQFEQKTMASADLKKTFGVEDFDYLVLTDHTSITEVRFDFGGEHVTTYDLFELRAMQRSADGAKWYTSTGLADLNVAGRITLGLDKIKNIEIRKTAGVDINLFLRHN